MRVSAKFFISILALAPLAGASELLAQAPAANAPRAAEPPGTRAVDPLMAAAQTAFEALPEEERKAIQADLIWATDFSGAVSGSFGPLTYRGIQAFERQSNVVADGILNATERKSLAAVATKARSAVRFAPRPDSRSKARVGLPQTLLVRSEPNTLGGTRWQSDDRKVTLDTFVSASETLEDQFVRTSTSNPGRKVTYKLLRPDFFVVTGETTSGKFYRRVVRTPAGISGFALGYEKALSPTWDRLTIAIANSFDATPVAEPAVAASPAAAPGVSANSQSNPAPASLAAKALEARSFARSASGLVVADGKLLLATSGLKDCRSPRVGNLALGPVSNDQATGLSIASVAGLKLNGPAPVLADGRTDAMIALAQGERPGGHRGLLVVPVSNEAGKLSGAFQPGASGAVILDAAGRVAGLLTSDPAQKLQVAGTVVARQYSIADAAQIGRFSARENANLNIGPSTDPVSTGQMVGSVGKQVVAISCS